MDKKIFISLLLVLGAFELYAKKAPEGSSTVVGGILVDLYGSHWNYTEPLQAQLPIRIVVEYTLPSGKPKTYVYKLETNSEGYYKIENAPDGKYIVKAIEIPIGQGGHITAVSEFGRWAKGKVYRYWGLLSGMMYRNEKDLIETHFEKVEANGMIDLGITHLAIKVDERMGGLVMKNYSPNAVAPWVHLSLIQGENKIVDLIVTDAETRNRLVDEKLYEKDMSISMVAPRDYFQLNQVDF